MATTPDTIAAWVREYSDTFGAAYHARDVTLLRPYCNVPSLRMTAAGPRFLMTPEDVDAHWQAAHDALRPRDYDHSVLHTVDVNLVNPAAAFVTADCSRYARDGSEIMRFWTSYTVALTEAGWRITAWLPHGDRRL